MESLALDAATSITNVVAGRVCQEIGLAWGFKDQLNMLKEKLLDTQALMNDLANAEHAEKSQLMSRWIQKLKAVAYSAEELMDDYTYEMLRRKHQGWDIIEGCRNFLRPSSNRIVFRTWMAHRIKQILSELNQLHTDPDIVGLQQLARKAVSASTYAGLNEYALDQSRRSPTTSGIIGRERDVKDLLEILLNAEGNSSDLPVMAIVGLGGLGKTTLARLLYEHAKVEGHFNGKKSWICVSEDFHVEKILKEMVESLTSNKCDLTNIGAIIENLQKELKGKRFFLVLDDVWNDNKDLWKSLKTELQRIGGLTGSVILITTRRHGVAKACAAITHKLKGLSEEDGWDLLKEQVFDEKTPYDSSFDDVGKRIVVEKCKGVPLAIKSIGSLLQSKQHESGWLSIEKSEIWKIEEDDNNNLMPSLLLSYNHINHVNVKQCFAYCAIFPKDSVMEKGKLIALWLAQGLIHDEVSGEKCFEILVNHSFLEKDTNDHQARYKMHDLVHDLATYVSKKELLVWNAKVKIDAVDSQVRHLVFNLKDDETAPETLAKEQMRKLRTINSRHGMPKLNSLTCARYMRTLITDEVGLTKLPSIIGQLVHLRYLDLSWNSDIKALPKSICKLYQLQTLRLLWCRKLKKLPKELHRLRELKHIETSYPVYASRGLQKLTSLQTLPRLGLRNGKGWTIDELGPLNQVKGDVYISGLDRVKNKEEATKAEIGKKDKILRLELCWDGNGEGNNDENVLGGLEPHPNIQSLKIRGFKGVSLPEWIMTMSVNHIKHATQLSHLTEVNLKNCKVCQKLPSLGQLPNLTILKLEGFDEVKCIGDEFYYENSSNISDGKVLFPALSELCIKGFKSLNNWMPPSSAVGTSVLPKLETLEIVRCRLLETVPALHLESLKDVKVDDVGVNQVLDIIKGSPSLNSLCVERVDEMVSLPKELSNCISLQTLKIRWCEKVEWIPGGMISLKQLCVWGCPSLGSIEDGVLHGLSSLRDLDISGCKDLKKMPKSLEDCTSLEELCIEDCPLIDCPEEEAVPDISKLQGLTMLTLKKAGGLMAYSLLWIPQLHGLNELEIGAWGEVEWDMSLTCTLPSLRVLRLYEFPNLKTLEPEPEQPIQQLLPPSLQVLDINSFQEMEAVPEWIGYLSSLETLYLWYCNKLKYLPSEQAMLRLTRLTELHILSCPELEGRCDKHNNGPEWPKISHFPEIKINWNNVQD